ncbi:hypothetical protein DRN67_01425 [Candidatus Micrarchaeota archaeon]|nr:MAG: hypothetical protein DRN67_01425 [Candidatus Micrarchaeota archaeon]
MSSLVNLMVSDEELASTILHKLVRKRKWGHSHTSFANLSKSAPSHLKGDFKRIAEQLIKERLLISKPTSYGLEVSLNPQKAEKIKQIVRKYFRTAF